ncbi:Pyruvate carboxyltransferase [Paramicrosporidium saccamoebae]|uniref:hydroxymethylglutaryl-CoA lyase n=1 Tax=Paramicrosporidium saccamoebae TaxID=1246581 RepID=A0A2H9TNC1_9FUNG|nr:Pyruvate carboxyltransferase [Paramicrosporidium saccamoebae]
MYRWNIRRISTKAVRLVEVGPRDGLQNEPNTAALTTKVKAEFIRRLANSGLRWIEAGSFVSPKWVPQMADTEAVLETLAKDPEIAKMSSLRLPVLVPNMTGLETALSSGLSTVLKEVAVFTAASDTFNKKNTNCTVEESLKRLAEVCKTATDKGLMVRGYVSTVVGCPYEGQIAPEKVRDVTLELLRLGCYEVSLGDTIGVGTAGNLDRVDPSKLAVHFHDTYGQALANILSGIRTIDSSVAGLGGCPYAPGASGNVATEDVVYMLHGLQYFTGVDLAKLVAAGEFITAKLGQTNRSRTANALLTKK